jgi:hypothetical protein
MKIKSELLNQINDLRKEIAEQSLKVGSLEVQKHNTLHHLAALQNSLNSINKDLIKEYGEDVMINPQTGEVTLPTKEKKINPK